MKAENTGFIKLFKKNERSLVIEQRRLELDGMERRGAAEEFSKVVNVL